ncbi:MAG: hypothetical protein KJS97_11335 [Alphaproteobacteria bacterium]|nr:hypothetical protein [Alphaproteobacteria bacterium]
MVDEVSARQGRDGRRTLGILEWSLGLVVLCFVALLVVAITTTRATPRDAGQAPIPQAAQPDSGQAPPARREPDGTAAPARR